MPHIPLPQLVFLCAVAAAFLTFMATLIYVNPNLRLESVRAAPPSRRPLASCLS